MRQLKAAWAQTEASAQEPVKNSEPLAAAMRQASAKLAACLAERAKQNADSGSPRDANLAFLAARVAKRAAQVHWSLYDAGETVHVVPALEPTALEADRYRSEIHPWISLQALLQGSARSCSAVTRRTRSAGFAPPGPRPRQRIAIATWPIVAAKFSEAMERFAAEVRAMSTSIEPARRELVIQERDDGLLAKTAYPAAIVTNVEFYYNRIDPFFWSGCVSLAAAGVLGVVLPDRCPQTVVLDRNRHARAGHRPGGRRFPDADVSDPLGPGHQHVRNDRLGGDVRRRADDLGDVPAAAQFARPGGLEPHGLAGNRPGAIAPYSHAPREKSVPDGYEYTGPCRLVARRPRLGAGPPLRHLSRRHIYILGVFQPGSWNSEYRLASFLPRADIGSTLPTASSLLVWLSSIFVTGTLTWYVPRLIPAAISPSH